MARRKKSSPAEDLMEAVAALPWWVGAVLAVVSYAWLHHVAAQPLPAPQPGTAHSVIPAVWKGLATGLQYVIPIVCLVGAAVSALRRRARAKLLQAAAQGLSSDVLNDMSWQEFEQLVGEGFRRQGFAVEESGGGGADGGVDLVLRKDGETMLVQCKQWRAFRVGVEVVRELYGVMAARGAAGGYVVTSGRFSDEAINFASGRNVKLMDGAQLLKLIQSAQQARAAPADDATPRSPGPAVDLKESIARAGAEASPACPKCSKPMVRRVARQGASAGSAFWGCTGYPACRGTREMN